MNTKSSRSAFLDILKLISCFGVIVIHVSGHGLNDLPAGSAGWLSCTLWDSLARFAVPVFFMCTGAVMFKPERGLDVKTVYRKYFLRYLIILLFWAWAYYIFKIVGQYVLTGWFEPNGFLNAITETLRFNHHLHLYYLQMLLLIYALLPVVCAFTRAATEKELNYAVGLWLVLGIALPVLRGYRPLSWFHGMVGYYEINMVYSSVGYALLGYVMSTRPLHRRKLGAYIACFAAGFAVTFGLTVWLSLSSGTVNTDFMEGMSPGPALMSIGLFGAVRILSAERQASARMQTLVEASFCIYLIHHFFVMVFRYIGFSVTLFAPIIEIPIETAVVFLLSLAGWWVLSKIPIVKDRLI